MTTEKREHRAFLPPRFQTRLGRYRWKVGRRLHDLRWALSSLRAADRYADRHLHLDRHFWLFVLGANNSGTTLLVRILESHPLMRSLPREGQRYTRAFPRPSDLRIGRVWGTRLERFRWTDQSDAEPATRARFDWAYCYDRRPGVILEKSPPHSARSLWLARHFQPSRFLLITRNPYAVCEGIRRRTGCTIEDAATHWARVNGCLADDAPELKNCLVMNYEGLCADPDGCLSRIERFLDLQEPFDRSVIHKRYQVHNADDAPSVIQDFNAKSIGRLSEKDIAVVTEIAGQVMRRWGYEPLEASAVSAGLLPGALPGAGAR